MNKTTPVYKFASRLCWIILLGLLAISLVVWGLFPSAIGELYVNGFYPRYSTIQRMLLGWCPVSIGDILYGIAVIFIVYKAILWVRRVIVRKQRTINRLVFTRKATGVIITGLLIYNVFNLSWGLNYDRKPVGVAMGVLPYAAQDSDINIITEKLISRVNEYKELSSRSVKYVDFSVISSHVLRAYDSLDNQTGIAAPKPKSLKSSIWGWLGNYTGFTGYYNPFTGEAQVNTTIPSFLQPFVALHEVAHQQGYAKENEASFVGFLAAKASNDDQLLYGTYLELFLYANRNLADYDSTAAKKYGEQLSKPVKRDLAIWRKFNEDHQSFIEPVIMFLYGKFLQSNEQPTGLRSYDEVTSLLIAYYKKYSDL